VDTTRSGDDVRDAVHRRMTVNQFLGSLRPFVKFLVAAGPAAGRA
jgi:hypothetical protein